MSSRKVKHIITDEEITEACWRYLDLRYGNLMPDEEYIFSESYTNYRTDLINRTRAGELRPDKVPKGWQYYTRKSLAAILIGALLAGITMPEAVIAGYKWLIQVVEDFFEDRTEYRYTTDIDEETEFIPMTFGYLPDGLVEASLVHYKERDKILFVNTRNDIYLEIVQRLIDGEIDFLYGSNVEIYYTEEFDIHTNLVKFTEKDDVILFLWTYEKYHIEGQTNLPKESLIKILENVEFE